MPVCPTTMGQGMVGALIETVDCHIRVLVQDAYRDIVGPDTVFAAAFTGLLTIYIALLGYQLLIGRSGLRVTDLPVSALKIGLILAFLTSWAAYQTVFFSLLFDGPRELTQAMLAPMARAGSGFDGDVYGGLERAFRDMSVAAGAYAEEAGPAANVLQGGPMLGSGLLWISAIGMLMSTIGLILAAKIVLAFLLAIGPIFIGFFLFEPTRGLFDGWLRTTIAFALTPLAVNVFGAAMLMMMQPFLATLAADAAREEFNMGVVITIGLIVGVFTLIMAFALRLGGGIAGGFRSGRETRAAAREAETAAVAAARAAPERAEQISAQVAALDRGGEMNAALAGMASSRRVADIAEAVAETARPAEGRLGQAYRRSARPAFRRGEDA
ncbi:MAG: type IV secretion system protein [Hyphomonadaceae bacterium]|nr:type IV secretion system protein [Hyphomonadaceae bacterium]